MKSSSPEKEKKKITQEEEEKKIKPYEIKSTNGYIGGQSHTLRDKISGD